MHGTIFQRLPVGPAPVATAARGLFDVAGAGEDFVVVRVRIDFDASEAGECAGVEHVAGVFMLFGFAKRVEFAGVAGADENDVAGAGVNVGQAEALLRINVRDVGIVAIFLNAEDVSAIAADGEQAVGLRGEGVNNVVFAGPYFARAPGLRRARRFQCLRARKCWRSLPAESQAARW